jgi:phospholipid transport system substrate-binding protein
MSIVMGTLRSIRSQWRPHLAAAALSGCIFAAFGLAGLTTAPPRAAAADPAVKFMAQVGRELMAAARTRSPAAMATVIERYGDVSYIGLYSLGSYRNQLSAEERTVYYGGMVRFISRYAASEAPKYPVARVEWADQSVRGASGLMVDSRVFLEDGSVYEVRWLLAQRGGIYKVRDAMVVGFWMTPFLKQLFEDYIAQNGGNPRALVAALNR